MRKREITDYERIEDGRGGTRLKPVNKKLRDAERERGWLHCNVIGSIYNSKATVPHILVNTAVVVTCVVAFLPVLLPPLEKHTIMNAEHFPLLTHQPYIHGLSIYLCVPLLVDASLDFLSEVDTSSSTDAKLYRLLIGVTVFVLSLLALLMCTDTSTSGTEAKAKPDFRLYYCLSVVWFRLYYCLSVVWFSSITAYQ